MPGHVLCLVEDVVVKEGWMALCRDVCRFRVLRDGRMGKVHGRWVILCCVGI